MQGEEIFILNDDGGIELNKVECRAIPEFRKLVERDRGGKIKGDNDGRKKYVAFAEFFYIYLVHNPKSIYRNLDIDRRREKAQEEAGLPDDWVIDKHITKAEEKYLESLDYSALYHSYLSANRSLFALGDDMELLHNHREKLRLKIDDIQSKIANEEDDEKLADLLKKENTYINELINLGDKIHKLIGKLPESLNIVEGINKKIVEEQTNQAQVTGGGSLNNREK